MHFRSNVRYFYREFDSIFLPRSSPKYSRTTIRAYFLLYFRHEAYYTRWSSHNWSLGRVCVYMVTLVVKEQENWPHWCPKLTSREIEDSCNRTLFLETWPWDTCGVNFLVVHVRARYVCGNNQILPWHSFWFGWSVGNCILYRFQDVYRSWLPVELKHEIVFPAALIKHHYSRGQKVKHGDILIYETDHHYLRRIPHRRNKRFTDKEEQNPK